MKTTGLLSAFTCLALGIASLSCGEKTEEGTALFTSFTYQGRDAVYDENPLDGTDFYTPILQGFYPDPAITRKGEDYYMVTSTFSYFPGVPLFHSRDLVNWRQIGHVLDRPSQLDITDGVAMSSGIFAPAITYNPHDDTFYMITTAVNVPDGGNFYVTARDPAGDWSDPVRLPVVGGIDPSLFFDDDGRGYIVHNADPDGDPLYEGHRAVRVWEFDSASGKVTGGGHVIVNGGVNLAEKPIWIEAPHLYKRHGRYYLMCAEGGTSTWHSEVIFGSDSPLGPFTPAPNNPILTQRHLAPGTRGYEVTSAGHADIVSTPGGGHYGVFLAVRPYEGNKYNTGRETFILPVDWSGEFPVFEGGLEPLGMKLPLPDGVENLTGRDGYLPNGNFTFTEKFDTPELDQRWIMIRTPKEEFFSTGRGLALRPRPVSIKERRNPSFVGYRQQHTAFTAETTLRYSPAGEDDLAGIVCFQNDAFNFVLGVTLVDGRKCVVLEKTEQGESQILATAAISSPGAPVTLRIEGDGRDYSFGFSEGGNHIWLARDVDASILSTQVAGGFVGNVIGLYATTAKDLKYEQQ